MLDYRTETFLTLYEEMNYRRTAERLQMTQPGVTQHIHYIENYYGVKLFVYDGHRLLRTPEAERLKRHIDSTRAAEFLLSGRNTSWGLPPSVSLKADDVFFVG